MVKKLEQGIANVIKKELQLDKLPQNVATEVLVYLDSQGIVRKVDGGFPQFQSRFTERANAELMVKQGWSKTERLI